MSIIQEKFAFVVLNYMSYEETENFLKSLRKFYNEVKVIVVDNGSQWFIKQQLERIAKLYGADLILLEKNLGFAKGNNIGIKYALSKGYNYIVCSNNDIVISEPILEKIYEDFNKYAASVVGPRILTPDGVDQNPLLTHRPSRFKASLILLKNSYAAIFLKLMLNYFKVYEYLKRQMKKNRVIKSGYVYALHGAFLAFGPRFFKFYKGFDEGVFLYGEELILAEMLFRKNLLAFFDADIKVFHNENATMKKVFGSELRIRPLLLNRKSIIYWYKKWYSGNQE